MRFCPYCAAKLANQAAHCTRCGKKLPTAQPPPKDPLVGAGADQTLIGMPSPEFGTPGLPPIATGLPQLGDTLPPETATDIDAHRSTMPPPPPADFNDGKTLLGGMMPGGAPLAPPPPATPPAAPPAAPPASPPARSADPALSETIMAPTDGVSIGNQPAAQGVQPTENMEITAGRKTMLGFTAPDGVVSTMDPRLGATGPRPLAPTAPSRLSTSGAQTVAGGVPTAPPKAPSVAATVPPVAPERLSTSGAQTVDSRPGIPTAPPTAPPVAPRAIAGAGSVPPTMSLEDLDDMPTEIGLTTEPTNFDGSSAAPPAPPAPPPPAPSLDGAPTLLDGTPAPAEQPAEATLDDAAFRPPVEDGIDGEIELDMPEPVPDVAPPVQGQGDDAAEAPAPTSAIPVQAVIGQVLPSTYVQPEMPEAKMGIQFALPYFVSALTARVSRWLTIRMLRRQNAARRVQLDHALAELGAIGCEVAPPVTGTEALVTAVTGKFAGSDIVVPPPNNDEEIEVLQQHVVASCQQVAAGDDGVPAPASMSEDDRREAMLLRLQDLEAGMVPTEPGKLEIRRSLTQIGRTIERQEAELQEHYPELMFGLRQVREHRQGVAETRAAIDQLKQEQGHVHAGAFRNGAILFGVAAVAGLIGITVVVNLIL